MTEQSEDEPDSLHIALIGTYPPRKCGIGTFTWDVAHSITKYNEQAQLKIIAIDNENDNEYPKEVGFTISQHRRKDYLKAAEYVNISSIDIVNIQHEYGIYGGKQGDFLLDFMKAINKPIVMTFHTILENPDSHMKAITQKMLDLSENIVVLAHKAKEFLLKIYDINDEDICVIPHGVPDVAFSDTSYYKDQFKFEGKTVLLTFGLLSPNKGLEIALKSLKPVVEKHPDVVYCIQGVTHPDIVKRVGEEYRIKLQNLTKKYGIQKNVVFMNKYLETKELTELIGASDIYITPYLSREQISSGTLAYAVGAGKAVVSTPYFFAEELLADNRGVLFDFNNDEQLSRALLDLLDDNVKLNKMRKNAYDFGREMIWKKVGKSYFSLLSKMHTEYLLHPDEDYKFDADLFSDIPHPSFRHLSTLTDDVALMQHAKFAIPDRNHGYSTDDAGRAIPILLKQFHETGDNNLLQMAKNNLAFLYHAQRNDGTFHNFFSYERKFLDKYGGEDTQGRVLWGLGYAIFSQATPTITQLAHHIFDRAIETLKLEYPQAKAYTMNGCYWFLRRFEGATHVERILKKYADDLISLYEQHKDEKENWFWFEDIVTYGRAKMCEVLLMAYEIFEDETYKKVALKTLDFLTNIVFEGESFAPIGSDGWKPKGKEKATFIQQPIEGWYFMDCYYRAFKITGDIRYTDYIKTIFEWFMGNNVTGTPLGNIATGSCYDGIMADGLNPNKGAESTLAFLYAVQIMNDIEAKEKIAATKKKDTKKK